MKTVNKFLLLTSGRIGRMAMCNAAVLTSLMHAAAGTTPSPAAPVVFAKGLQNPSKLLSISGGNLLVTETGTKANSGRVSLIDSFGTRHTLIEGLPSGLSAPDSSPDGPNGIALFDRTLYIANGEGDTHVNGPRAGTIEPNPNGPSSPIFSTLLKVEFSDAPEFLLAGFSLAFANHSTLADGEPVTLKNEFGQTATLQLVTAFRPNRPDPVTIYRNTHLYGVTALSSNVDSFFVDDAGDNAIWQVSLSDKTPTLLVRFPNTPDPIAPAGPPTSEAVPTSVRPYGTKLLVSLLSGVPFVPGASRVVSVDPATGDTVKLIGNLSSAIDVLPWKTSSGDEFFVLEYSTNLGTGAPGQLLLYAPSGNSVVASGLTAPSSMAIQAGSDSIFFTDRTDGLILRIPLPN
jgi:hypothetical protein